MKNTDENIKQITHLRICKNIFYKVIVGQFEQAGRLMMAQCRKVEQKELIIVRLH
jgi:hypothetical protein